MKRCLYLLPVLFTLILIISPWSVSAARTTPRSVNGVSSIRVQGPTATPTPPAAAGQQRPAWIQAIAFLFCGMVGMLVLGVGAAILLVRVRERIR
jgi:hypothetical protein